MEQGTSDVDGDGVEDHNDNCPHVYNPDQMDQEGNGTGDVCDDPPRLVCIYYRWLRTVWPCW